MLDRPVTLRLHIRRFQCSACDHRPWEKSETFGDWVKWTERLYDQVRQEFLHGCPCQDLARRYGLSARTVFRWTFEKSRGGRPRKLGRALGIDEYARRKGHRYNTIIVDLDKGRPITTFKGRRVEDVVKWFKSRPQAERDGVEVVVLDMSKSFYASIRQVFGDQVEVIDRFHVVQQAVGALDSVLRSVQKQLNPHEAKELKKLRKRWLKLPNQLEVDALIARADWRLAWPTAISIRMLPRARSKHGQGWRRASKRCIPATPWWSGSWTGWHGRLYICWKSSRTSRSARLACVSSKGSEHR
jgi:transposase